LRYIISRAPDKVSRKSLNHEVRENNQRRKRINLTVRAKRMLYIVEKIAYWDINAQDKQLFVTNQNYLAIRTNESL
jgi:hypothetical protein